MNNEHEGEPVAHSTRKIMKRNQPYGEFRKNRENIRAASIVPESVYLFAEEHGFDKTLFRVASKFVW